MVQAYPTRKRSSRAAIYLRAIAAAVLMGGALFCAHKIVAWLSAMPAAWLLLLAPALLIALAIEVAVSDHAVAVYTWKTFRSEAAGAVIGLIVVLGAAIRIGEPVIAQPWPWLAISCAVVPFAAAIGYGRSRLFAAHPADAPPA